jgi:hypothetical protein
MLRCLDLGSSVDQWLLNPAKSHSIYKAKQRCLVGADKEGRLGKSSSLYSSISLSISLSTLPELLRYY